MTTAEHENNLLLRPIPPRCNGCGHDDTWHQGYEGGHWCRDHLDDGSKCGCKEYVQRLSQDFPPCPKRFAPAVPEYGRGDGRPYCYRAVELGDHDYPDELIGLSVYPHLAIEVADEWGRRAGHGYAVERADPEAVRAARQANRWYVGPWTEIGRTTYD